MLEARRQAYLQSLGIVNWAIRARNIGNTEALSSSVVSITPAQGFDSRTQQTVENEIKNGIKKSTQKDVKNDIKSDIKSGIKNNTQREIGPVTLKPATKAAAQPSRFMLVLQQLTTDTIIIVDTEQVEVPGLSAEQHVLLHKIKQASKGVASQLSFAEKELGLFRWPVVNNPAIAQGAQQLVDALRGVLHAQYQSGIRHAIVFGAALAAYLFPGQDSASLVDSPETALYENQMHLYLTYSLDTLAHRPDRKRHAWERMKRWSDKVSGSQTMNGGEKVNV